VITEQELAVQMCAIPVRDLQTLAKKLWPSSPTSIERRASTPHLTYSGRRSTEVKPPRPVKGSWQYHLQKMVIADDPTQYLKDNI
jgi:hypothetical protein